MFRLGMVVCCLALVPAVQGGTVQPYTCEEQIRSTLRKHKLREKNCGVYVATVQDGRALAAINADTPLILASNKKIMTTAAALDMLGPGFEFVTKVCRTGPIEGGVLRGDLVIVGGGDPNISGRHYEGDALGVPRQWIAAIRAAGITSIEGNVVADDRIFDRELVHPSWPANQLDRWFCAPSCGLSFNDNCIDVSVSPGDVAGTPAKISLNPPTGYVRISNSCKTTTSKRKHKIIIARRAGTRSVTVAGNCWLKAGETIGHVTVDDPALLTATVMREQLVKAGIAVSGRAVLAPRDIPPRQRTEICRTVSDLATSVMYANKRSQNFYAEQIHKMMGAVMLGDGSFAGGNRALTKFLSQLGIEPDSYTSADGSGLSRQNRFTARQIGTVLMYMVDHPSSALFIDSLTVAGVEGTLRNRLKSDTLRGLIRAKTGFISGVRTLSGYVVDRNARPLIVFSFVTNGGYPYGAQQDICELLVKISGASR